MTQEQPSDTETQLDTADNRESQNFGLKLKTQRELLKMTQTDAASNLKLDVSYIVAMETEDFSGMTSKSYVYGYIRGYAKLLKLPEQEILDMYKQGIREEHQLLPDYMGHKPSYSNAPMLNKTWSVWFIIAVAIVAVIWWYINQH